MRPSRKLSKKAASLLSALQYQANAGWGVNILPFGSIFWLDEMPSMAELVGNIDDMSLIHSMFGLRLQLWDGHSLSAQDQQLWDAVKIQVPNWAFFQRLHLSNEQKLAREQAELQVRDAFEDPVKEVNEPDADNNRC